MFVLGGLVMGKEIIWGMSVNGVLENPIWAKGRGGIGDLQVDSSMAPMVMRGGDRRGLRPSLWSIGGPPPHHLAPVPSQLAGE